MENSNATPIKIPSVPTIEEISRNYNGWKKYSDNLALTIKKAKPMIDRIYYTSILKGLFNVYIKDRYPNEVFDESEVTGSSVDNGFNDKSDYWLYQHGNVYIKYNGRITTRYDDLDYFIDKLVTYNGDVIYSSE